MVSTKRWDVLTLVRKVALAPLYYFREDVSNLNLEKVKQSFVFRVKMEGIKMRLQYQKIDIYL